MCENLSCSTNRRQLAHGQIDTRSHKTKGNSKKETILLIFRGEAPIDPPCSYL